MAAILTKLMRTKPFRQPRPFEREARAMSMSGMAAFDANAVWARKARCPRNTLPPSNVMETVIPHFSTICTASDPFSTL